MDIPGQPRFPHTAGYTPSMVIRREQVVPPQHHGSHWNPAAHFLLSYRHKSPRLCSGWSSEPWSGSPHSLEDEGHGLLPVLPLEWQGPCEHLELQREQNRADEFVLSSPTPSASATAATRGGTGDLGLQVPLLVGDA